MPIHGRSKMQHFPSLTEEHVLSRTYTNAGKSAFWAIWGTHVASLILATWLDGGHNGEIISLHLQNQPGGAAAHHHLGMRYQCQALIQLTISKRLKFKKYLNCLWLFNLGTEQPSGRLYSECQNVCSSSLSRQPSESLIRSIWTNEVETVSLLSCPQQRNATWRTFKMKPRWSPTGSSQGIRGDCLWPNSFIFVMCRDIL